jgi:hypothetical protein
VYQYVLSNSKNTEMADLLSTGEQI